MDGGVAANTYDGREELRSRAASGHEGGACYVLTEVETLPESSNRHMKSSHLNRKYQRESCHSP